MLKKIILSLSLVIPLMLFAMKISKPSYEAHVTVQTQDGAEFKLSYDLVRHSATIANLIEDAGVDAPIPLPNIQSSIWTIIQDQLHDIDNIYSNNEPKVALERINNNLKALTARQLVELINAINYLDIPELLRLALLRAGSIDITFLTIPMLMSIPKDIRNQIVLKQLYATLTPLDSEKLKVLQGHSDRIDSVYATPDGSKIVSGSSDKTIRIWDIHSGKQLNVLKRHVNYVNTVCVTPDGSMIVSGDNDNIRTWDIHTGDQLKVLKGHNHTILSVCVTLDGNKIVSGSIDKSIRIWDVKTGNQLNVLNGHKDAVNSVCVTPDGSKIVSGSFDNTICIWDVQTGKQLNVLKGHEDVVNSVCVTPDGRKIISGSWDETIRIWDIHTGNQLNILKGHEDIVGSVCITPDNNKIISGSLDKTIRIWDVHTGNQLNILKGHTDYVYSVCVTPDGSKIISGSWDKTIRIWDLLYWKRYVAQLTPEQLETLWIALKTQRKEQVLQLIDMQQQHKEQNPAPSICIVS